jgi:hypothetical protein
VILPLRQVTATGHDDGEACHVSDERTHSGRKGEEGDIISRWLMQMLATMAVFALVAYEVIAVGVAAVRVDDIARQVARAARDAYRVEQSPDRMQATADGHAQSMGATLVALEEDGGELSVTVEKRARTLIVHRVGPLEDLVTPASTRRVARR